MITAGESPSFCRKGDWIVHRYDEANAYRIPQLYLDAEAGKIDVDAIDFMRMPTDGSSTDVANNKSDSSRERSSSDTEASPTECTAFPARAGSGLGVLGLQQNVWQNKNVSREQRRPQLIMTTHGLLMPAYRNREYHTLESSDELVFDTYARSSSFGSLLILHLTNLLSIHTFGLCTRSYPPITT